MVVMENNIKQECVDTNPYEWKTDSLFDTLPSVIHYNDNIYYLKITKGDNVNIEYVNPHNGVLLNTRRRDKTLNGALHKMLELLIQNDLIETPSDNILIDLIKTSLNKD
jgi:hypothetical protein